MINQIVSGLGDYNPSAILQTPPEQGEQLYRIRQDNIQTLARENGQTPEQQHFIEKQFEKEPLPFYYEGADSWKTMLMYGTTYGLFLVVVIGLFTANIFGDEFQLRADGIFFSTKDGQSKAVVAKILAGLITTTFIYWGGTGLLSALSFGVMGIGGFQTSFRIEESYSLYNLTYGQVYCLILGCGYIASLLSATISMLVSAKMKTSTLAICLPFFLFCVTPFIGRALSVTIFFQLTPDQLMNILNTVKIPYIYQIGSLVFRQIPLITLGYSLLSLSLLPVIYVVYRRKATR